jgi:hypothetical protein
MVLRIQSKENWLLLLVILLVLQISGCVGTAAHSGLLTPATPNGVSAIAGKSQISLSWDPSSGATSYIVKRAAAIGGPYTQVASSSSIGYVDPNLTKGATYFYVVSAVNPAGSSATSAPVSATAAASTPSGLVVSSVAISPLSASTTASGNLSFSATVQGTVSDKSVAWFASIGSITAAGAYTAPKTSGTATITATSNADPTKSASASITVTEPTPPPPTVTSVLITPVSASTAANGTLAFSATVQGTTSNKSVTWSASAGSITAAGAFTAPKNTGTVSITATSNADPTKFASANITVTATPPSVTSVAVSPLSASTTTSGVLPFTATVQGTTSNKSVTWSASAGSITVAGVFTAPKSPGTVSITATSTADPTKSASARVTITAPAPPAPTVTSVAISPLSATTTTGGTLAFTATVQGTTSNKSVTWTTSLGSITSSGTYTAPATVGSAKITATSSADATKSASVSVTVNAPAPPPPPAPAPPPPVPTTSKLPTAFFDLSWSAMQASHFPSVPFGGIRAWDTNTTWEQIETSPGTYNWANLDAWLSLESSHGKDVMYTFGFVPHWASMRPSEACSYVVTDPGCAAPPSDVDSGDNIWKAFVTALVNHSLSSPDLHIAYYELWNEPDLQRNWTGTPAQLVTMAKDAYAIIHQLDPSARVIGPSPSTANQYGVHFLPAYYAAGGANSQDFVGMHAYLYDGSNFSSSPAGITVTITQLQALMATYGISDKSIWFTEGNWGDVNNTSMTGAQKAAYLTQEYLLMWSSGKVARYYWYAWDSTALGTLWDSSSGINTAGIAYGRLTDWLVGSVHQDQPCSEASDGTWTCNLTLASGYPGQIFWNATTSKTIALSPAYATYETLADSTVHTIQANQVAIGNEPILAIGGQAVQ